jgi:hypothetical protein
MSRNRRLFLVVLAIGACMRNSPKPDAATGGAGGGVTLLDAGNAGGADGAAAGGGGGGGGGAAGVGDSGTGGATSDARAPDARTPDARTPDAPAADAPIDAPRDTIPPDGPRPVFDGPGCGRGSFCGNLIEAYAEAVLRAKSCTVGAPDVCNASAPGSLSCHPCRVRVTNRAELDPLLRQFEQGGCSECLIPGGLCHPTICPTVFPGICVAGPGGRGTCVTDEPPEECPPGTEAGPPCPIDGWICKTVTGPRRTCLCRQLSGQMVWECYPRMID